MPRCDECDPSFGCFDGSSACRKQPLIVVTSSQHHRTPGTPGPASPPADAEAWAALATLDQVALRELGLRAWNEPGDTDFPVHGRTLMLLPAEWHPHIPEGLPLVRINGKPTTFSRATSDDDMRYGVLPYGVLAQASAH